MDGKPKTLGIRGFTNEKTTIKEIPVTISEESMGISFRKSMAFLAFLPSEWIPIEAITPNTVEIKVAQNETRRESRIEV